MRTLGRESQHRECRRPQFFGEVGMIESDGGVLSLCLFFFPLAGAGQPNILVLVLTLTLTLIHVTCTRCRAAPNMERGRLRINIDVQYFMKGLFILRCMAFHRQCWQDGVLSTTGSGSGRVHTY